LSGEYASTYLYDVVNRLIDVSMTRDGVAQSRTFQFNAQQRLQSVSMPEMDGA
jgi:hypothetical protein